MFADLSMLLRRGADACQEDGNGCVPSFQAKKLQANECRQIISQHLYDRTENLRQDAISVCLLIQCLFTPVVVVFIGYPSSVSTLSL